MNNYTVSTLSAGVGTEEYLAECVEPERFLQYCRECVNFGKRWSCPPFARDPAEIWKSYETLWLYARVIRPGEAMKMPELMQVFREEKEKLSRQLLELERRTENSLSLAAGACVSCSSCTREKGLACIHPDTMRYSVEALGGDVAKTMEKYLDFPLRWIRSGEMPEYLTLVGGLLLNRKNRKPAQLPESEKCAGGAV